MAMPDYVYTTPFPDVGNINSSILPNYYSNSERGEFSIYIV